MSYAMCQNILPLSIWIKGRKMKRNIVEKINNNEVVGRTKFSGELIDTGDLLLSIQDGKDVSIQDDILDIDGIKYELFILNKYKGN
jgi:hypothetical protein